ncbi:MAG: hypothetical protein WAS55_13355 [Saprospiraceae bacterium]
MKGYIKKKKKLVPEFLNFVGGEFPGISWQGQKIPELIWIGFLINTIGLKKTIGLIIEYHKIFSEVVSDKKLNPFLLSSTENISKEEAQFIKENLQEKNILFELENALIEFFLLFPECPLNKLFNKPPLKELNVIQLKNLITELSDRHSNLTIYTFGAVIYASIYLGKINVPHSSSLSNFAPLNEYPNTDASKILASSIRASINIYFDDHLYNFSNIWIKYFWNRCYSFEPAKI